MTGSKLRTVPIAEPLSSDLRQLVIDQYDFHTDCLYLFPLSNCIAFSRLQMIFLLYCLVWIHQHALKIWVMDHGCHWWLMVVIASEVGTCIAFWLQVDLNDKNSDVVDIDCHHRKEHEPWFQQKNLNHKTWQRLQKILTIYFIGDKKNSLSLKMKVWLDE